MSVTVSKTIELILCANRRPCERCKQATWWAKPGQRVRGLCLDCAPRDWSILPDEAITDAILTLLDVFERGEVHQERPGPLIDAAKYEPWTRATVIVRWALGSQPVRLLTAWVRDRDAGPCSLCQRVIVRYGPMGRALCRDCHRVSTHDGTEEEVAP